MFLPTNSSCTKSRIVLRQSACGLRARKPLEQSKRLWRGMVRLYLSYIKAENVYRPIVGGDRVAPEDDRGPWVDG
jgi:hypothetical protein